MLQLETVLCPVDFTPLSRRALSLAAEIAERFSARLVLHHDLGAAPPSYLGVGWQWREEHEGEEVDLAKAATEKLRRLMAELPAAVAGEAKVSHDPLDEVLLHLATELPAELIVMASHGKSDATHRSLTERVILAAPCPVLTIGVDARPAPLFAGERCPAVIPLDLTALSERALAYARELDAHAPLRLHLVHVVAHHATYEHDIARDHERLSELRAALPAASRGQARILTTAGEIADGIEGLVEETGASLVIMTAHKKGVLRRWASGSTTFAALHGLRVPVWFVPDH